MSKGTKAAKKQPPTAHSVYPDGEQLIATAEAARNHVDAARAILWGLFEHVSGRDELLQFFGALYLLDAAQPKLHGLFDQLERVRITDWK